MGSRGRLCLPQVSSRAGDRGRASCWGCQPPANLPWALCPCHPLAGAQLWRMQACGRALIKCTVCFAELAGSAQSRRPAWDISTVLPCPAYLPSHSCSFPYSLLCSQKPLRSAVQAKPSCPLRDENQQRGCCCWRARQELLSKVPQS